MIRDNINAEDLDRISRGYTDLMFGLLREPVSKAAYQKMIRLLAQMCATPIRFAVEAITAENDRVLVEARSTATLISGELYSNAYVFSIRIRDGRISWIAEHYNADIVEQKLLPLMAKLQAEQVSDG